MNYKSIGICLTGNLHEHVPNYYQKKELAKLIKGLMAQFKLGEEDIRFHKDYKQTICPGYITKEQIKEWIHSNSTAIEIKPEPQPNKKQAKKNKIIKMLSEAQALLGQL